MSTITLPLVSDPARVQELAAHLKNDTDAFRYYVERMWEEEHRTETELDALVDDIAAQVVPAIDCTECANCCRALQVGLTPDDAQPLAEALQLSPDEMMRHLVNRVEGQQLGEWGTFRHIPCPLLANNLCTVYDARPQACRTYPAFTPHFFWLMKPIFAGASQCPIIFNVIEQLKVRLGW